MVTDYDAAIAKLEAKFKDANEDLDQAVIELRRSKQFVERDQLECDKLSDTVGGLAIAISMLKWAKEDNAAGGG